MYILTDKQKEFLYLMKEQNRLHVVGLGMYIHPTIGINIHSVLDEGKYSDEDREWLNELREDWKDYLKTNL
jgi:hypothetical protein